MKYYEVLFSNNYGICIKSEVEDPTIQQVSDFLQEDMDKLGLKTEDIVLVDEISLEEARNFYDMENEANFPVLGKIMELKELGKFVHEQRVANLTKCHICSDIPVKWKKEIQEKQEELLGKAEAELQEWLSQNGLIMGGGFAYKKTEDDAPEATVEPRFVEMLEDARDEYGWDFTMEEIPLKCVCIQRNVEGTPVGITIPIQCSCQKDSFLAGLKQHALEMDGRDSTPDGHCIRDLFLDLYEKLSTNWGVLDNAGMPQHKYILVSVDEDMEIYTEMFHSKLTAQETMLRELIYACGQEHIDIPDEVFQNRWTEYYEKNGEFSFGPYGASIDGRYAWHITKIS